MSCFFVVWFCLCTRRGTLSLVNSSGFSRPSLVTIVKARVNGTVAWLVARAISFGFSSVDIRFFVRITSTSSGRSLIGVALAVVN